MLRSPLYLFSFLNRRHSYARKIRASSELSILGYHLKYNLWFEDSMDFVNLGDDFSIDVDSAMIARRMNFPGKTTPEGILTKGRGSNFGNLIAEIENKEADNILDFGYLLLSINEESMKNMSECMQYIFDKFQHDRRTHDFTMLFGDSGITMHCGAENNEETFKRLYAHCELSKYRSKANNWYGIALSPSEAGQTRLVIGLSGVWQPNPDMDNLLPRFGPPLSPRQLKSILSAHQKETKVGVNEPCPCGSGKKYKKCCRQ